MLPAAAMIEIASEAAKQIKSSRSITLHRIQLQGACVLDSEKPLNLQTDYSPDRRMLQLSARNVDETTWQPLMSAEISDDIQSEIFDPSALWSARAACDESFTAAECYDYCDQIGLQYSQRFRGIQDGVRRAGEMVAEVKLDASLSDEASEYAIHPALLDCCFQAIVVTDPNYNRMVDGLFLPAEIREVRFVKSPGLSATVHVRLVSKTRNRIIADLKDGIYATNFGGGQVDITSGKFVFQCTDHVCIGRGNILIDPRAVIIDDNINRSVMRCQQLRHPLLDLVNIVLRTNAQLLKIDEQSIR